MEMDEDNEVHHGLSHFDMDDAFCTRMLKAIVAGLECPPVGIVTTPGTKNPKFIPTEPSPLSSSLGGTDF